MLRSLGLGPPSVQRMEGHFFLLSLVDLGSLLWTAGTDAGSGSQSQS